MFLHLTQDVAPPETVGTIQVPQAFSCHSHHGLGGASTAEPLHHDLIEPEEICIPVVKPIPKHNGADDVGNSMA